MNETTLNTLSKDELIKQLLRCFSTIEKLTAQGDKNQQLISELNHTVAELTHQIGKLQTMLFGQRSEKQKNPTKKTSADKPAKPKTPTSDKDSTKKNGRRKLPENLERRVEKYDIPEDERRCPNGGPGKLHCIGKDVSEQLGFVPAQFYVIEKRRYKYSCSCCKQVLMAPIPSQPIEKGLADASVLAELLVCKYEEHMPLYRLERRTARWGYEIPRSTLCDWVMACADRLAPLVEAMSQEMLLGATKIHTDDTIIPVQAPDKVHNGRLWVYIGSKPQSATSVIYRYSRTRAGKYPQAFLKDYQGYIQADAYSGYDACFTSGEMVEVACWAHARRYYVDAYTKKTKPDDVAVIAVETYIAKLYKIEAKVRNMSDTERFYYRKRMVKPILRGFYRYLRQMSVDVLPKSPTGKAIAYTLNHWRALNHYLCDGHLSIDNNVAERAMKSVVLGRKNYLFAGSEKGAESAAVIYSLVETCKANGINRFEYFKDVLARLPETLNKDIRTLLPQYWKPAAN